MNNAEYLRLMKKQREIAKMQEAEIHEALQLDPEPEPEPEKMEPKPNADDGYINLAEALDEEQEEHTDDVEPDGENGTEGSDQGLEG